MELAALIPTVFAPNMLMVFGCLVVLGLIAGELAHRTPFMPRITGFMLIGALIGPSALNVLTPDLLLKTKLFIDMALAIILFELGRTLNLRDIIASRGTLLMSAAESLLSFILVAGGLYLLGFPMVAAAIAGAIGISSSPAIVMMVAREFNAKGPVTRRAMHLLAGNNIFAFLAFTLLLVLAHIKHDTGLAVMLLHPLYLIAGSIAIAAVLYFLAGILLTYLLKDREEQHFTMILALLILGLGLAHMFKLSPLLSSLLFGVMVTSMKGTRLLQLKPLAQDAELFFIILFVLAGAKLKLHSLDDVWPLALAFVILRSLGKQLGIYLASLLPTGDRTKPLSQRQQVALGAALMPMAGMAIGLTTSFSNLYPEIGVDLAIVVLAGVAILETIGPLATEWGFKYAREISSAKKLKH